MPLVIREFVREIAPIGVGTAVAFNRRSMKTGKFPEDLRDYSRSAAFSRPNFSMR